MNQIRKWVHMQKWCSLHSRGVKLMVGDIISQEDGDGGAKTHTIRCRYATPPSRKDVVTTELGKRYKYICIYIYSQACPS